MSDELMARIAHLDFVLRRCVEEGECLLWTGSLACRGHKVPIVRLPLQLPGQPGDRRKPAQAVARLVWEEAHRQAVPPGWRVWRCCGSLRCVHPSHLRAGPARKMIEWQKRAGCFKASPAKRARITAARRSQSNIKIGLEAAREIRGLQGEASAQELAGRFGVDDSLIYAIWHGQIWRESPGGSVFSWRPD